ncbi:MAG: hypothetical protein AAFS13_00280 [Pseudomonadota bacterium]
MNLWIILAIVAVICLLNRGPREERRQRRHHRRKSYDYDREKEQQIERLSARVATLEEILLDRDRRFRDQFRGL